MLFNWVLGLIVATTDKSPITPIIKFRRKDARNGSVNYNYY